MTLYQLPMQSKIYILIVGINPPVNEQKNISFLLNSVFEKQLQSLSEAKKKVKIQIKHDWAKYDCTYKWA